MSSVTVVPHGDNHIHAMVKGRLTKDVVKKMKGGGTTSVAMYAEYCDDFRLIGELDKLESLYLSGEVKNIDWERLYELGCLKQLGISDLYATDIDFSRFENLNYLNMTVGRKINSVSVISSKLKAFRLYKCPFDNLSFIASTPNLKSLSLMSSHRLKTLQGIEELKKLSLLELEGLVNLNDIRSMAKLSSLRSLLIINCNRIDDVEALSTLTNLEELLIGFDVDNIKFLKAMTGLKRLRISSKIADGDLHTLLEMPNLEGVLFQNRRHYSHKEKEVHEIFESRGLVQLGNQQGMVRFPDYV